MKCILLVLFICNVIGYSIEWCEENNVNNYYYNNNKNKNRIDSQKNQNIIVQCVEKTSDENYCHQKHFTIVEKENDEKKYIVFDDNILKESVEIRCEFKEVIEQYEFVFNQHNANDNVKNETREEQLKGLNLCSVKIEHCSLCVGKVCGKCDKGYYVQIGRAHV